MIAPYFSLGKLRFASKKGVTSVTPAAEAFVENSLKIHGVDYVAFCTHCIRDLKLTPLFEWCSASDPIGTGNTVVHRIFLFVCQVLSFLSLFFFFTKTVLRHSEDKLILTGLRHMHTGQVSYHQRNYFISLLSFSCPSRFVRFSSPLLSYSFSLLVSPCFCRVFSSHRLVAFSVYPLRRNETARSKT